MSLILPAMTSAPEAKTMARRVTACLMSLARVADSARTLAASSGSRAMRPRTPSEWTAAPGPRVTPGNSASRCRITLSLPATASARTRRLRMSKATRPGRTSTTITSFAGSSRAAAATAATWPRSALLKSISSIQKVVFSSRSHSIVFPPFLRHGYRDIICFSWNL
ncbi:hypothetical protein MTAT_30160 [Moorella thermoacetica]|uniref:Uncharacterized protein n=1 Tax=Neomoorella thermoacetica TaxID=1525 RepID=A0ABY3N1V4_NEOTH|nr:hypothetical protein MTAT_30160 [Moorella thermoacetica]